MKKQTVRKVGEQARVVGPIVAPLIAQLVLPMVEAIASTKQGLLEFVHRMGMSALDEVLGVEAARIAGPKGKHDGARQFNHWGHAPAELTLGGRRVQVKRPRVRAVVGGDVALPSFERLSESDPLPERVLKQILLGVSTRGYAESLEPVPVSLKSRGTSKSAAGRHLVERTRAKTAEFLSRRLDDVAITAMFVDGLELAGHTVVLALGVTVDGTKVPLGLALGSTENAPLCTSLLQKLLDRGLKIEHPILATIDGGKGIRKALTDVLGDRVFVQRCQEHKKRNVLDHVPDSRKPYVRRQLRDAYQSDTTRTARRRLKQLVSWLDRNGEPDAAASLREGLEETLTVHKLGLPKTLRRTFSTTNPIENMNGTVRRVSRNVKRWRDGTMARRWVAFAVLAAQAKFRRIKGHRDMPALVTALSRSLAVDAEEAA